MTYIKYQQIHIKTVYTRSNINKYI